MISILSGWQRWPGTADTFDESRFLDSNILYTKIKLCKPEFAFCSELSIWRYCEAMGVLLWLCNLSCQAELVWCPVGPHHFSAPPFQCHDICSRAPLALSYFCCLALGAKSFSFTFTFIFENLFIAFTAQVNLAEGLELTYSPLSHLEVS